MLRFNLKRIFTLRGIENPLPFMIKNGIVRHSAANLLKPSTVYVKIDYLDKLCVLLNCTPNDFFEWYPDTKTVVADNHPLHSLKRAETVQKITEIIKDIPIEKMERIEALLNELKNE